MRQKEWLYDGGKDLSAARHASALSVFGSGDVLEKKFSSRSFDTREERKKATGTEFDYMTRPFILLVLYHGTLSHAPVFVWLLFTKPVVLQSCRERKILIEGFLLRRNFPCSSCKCQCPRRVLFFWPMRGMVDNCVLFLIVSYACAQCLSHHSCISRIGCVLRTIYIHDTVIYCLMLLKSSVLLLESVIASKCFPFY